MFYYFEFFGNEMLLNMEEFASFEIQTDSSNKESVCVFFKFFQGNNVFFNVSLQQLEQLEDILNEIMSSKNFLDCAPIIKCTDLVNLHIYQSDDISIQNKVTPFLISKNNISFIYTSCENKNQSIIRKKDSEQLTIQETVSDLISHYFFNPNLQSKKYSL
jgi:hypothetical protein